MEEVKKDFANIIHRARKSKGLKQYELAEKAGVSNNLVSRMERNVGYISLEAYAVVGAALGLRLVVVLVNQTEDVIDKVIQAASK